MYSTCSQTNNTSVIVIRRLSIMAFRILLTICFTLTSVVGPRALCCCAFLPAHVEATPVPNACVPATQQETAVPVLTRKHHCCEVSSYDHSSKGEKQTLVLASCQSEEPSLSGSSRPHEPANCHCHAKQPRDTTEPPARVELVKELKRFGDFVLIHDVYAEYVPSRLPFTSSAIDEHIRFLNCRDRLALLCTFRC